MTVRAVTPCVPSGHGLRFYRDLDFHDRANDERVDEFFDDLYGITSSPRGFHVRPVRGPRRGNTPMLGRAGHQAGLDSRPARPPSPTSVAVSSAASTHRSAPDTQPSPGSSARADLSKETA